MAYRQFHNEKYYEAPDVGIVERGLARMNETISAQMAAAAEAKKKQLATADAFKYDLGKGSFENDDKIFQELNVQATARGQHDLRNTGQLSPELQYTMRKGQVDKSASDWQYKAMTDMVGQIDKKESDDKLYYDPSFDREMVKQAAYGKDESGNQRDYRTRGEPLKQASERLFTNPNSFKGRVYAMDYAKTYGAKQDENASGDPYKKSSNYMSTPFIDEKGLPGVTTVAAKQFLNSRPDGSVGRWVENLVDEQMMDEVAYAKEHNSNMKDMSDADALNYLKLNPKENTLNQELYSNRVVSRAKSEMMDAVTTNKKTDFNTSIDKAASQGKFLNPNIVISDTTTNEMIGEDAAAPNLFVGRKIAGPLNNMPGAVIRTKTGKPIPLDMSPRFSVNVRNGKLSEHSGSSTFNMTGYQSVVYDQHGVPKMLNINELNSLPPEEFAKLSPQAGIGFKGFYINDGKKLEQLSAKQSDLDDQLAVAREKGDVEKEENILDQLNRLSSLRERFNLSEDQFSQDDQMSALKQEGINISTIKEDVIIKPSAQDFSTVNAVTVGLDLSNPAKLPAAVNAFNEAYSRAYQNAAAKGFKSDNTKKLKPPPTKGSVLMINPKDGKQVWLNPEDKDEAVSQGFKLVQ